MFKSTILIAFICWGARADYSAVLPSNCDGPCTLELSEPVCVFNGEGYEIFDNNCAVASANCTRGYVLEKVEMRSCLERTNLDPEFDVCNWKCPMVIDPVCATNGTVHKMFDNSCLLGRQNCRENNVWTLASRNICEEIEREEKAEKCSKTCTREYKPVCGYDGKNYTVFSNKCQYEVSECIRENEWFRVPVITCNRKLNVDLPIPEEEKDKDCPASCRKIYFPVCGFDGQNYKIFSNSCTLKVAHCEYNRNWVKASFTKCLFRKND